MELEIVVSESRIELGNSITITDNTEDYSGDVKRDWYIKNELVSSTTNINYFDYEPTETGIFSVKLIATDDTESLSSTASDLFQVSEITNFLKENDFLDDMVKGVLYRKIDYIYDDRVRVYYNKLLSNYGISRNGPNLPTIDNLSQAVKNYLITSVCIEVCRNALAGNIQEYIEGTTSDQWKQKRDSYLLKLSNDLSYISSDDVYSEVPTPDESTSSSVFSWGRG